MCTVTWFKPLLAQQQSQTKENCLQFRGPALQLHKSSSGKSGYSDLYIPE